MEILFSIIAFSAGGYITFLLASYEPVLGSAFIGGLLFVVLLKLAPKSKPAKKDGELNEKTPEKKDE